MINDKQQVTILFGDLGETQTGIELSALRRAETLVTQLNIQPIILTMSSRPLLRSIATHLKLSGRCHPNLEIVSLYELAQSFGSGSDIVQDTFQDYNYLDSVSDLIPREVPSTQDLKYFDKRDNLRAYKVYSKISGQLSHINYFRNTIKISTDYFHSSGAIYSQRFFHPSSGERLYELLFDSSGKIALVKIFENIVNPLDGGSARPGHYLPSSELPMGFTESTFNAQTKDSLHFDGQPALWDCLNSPHSYLPKERDFSQFILQSYIQRSSNSHHVLMSDKSEQTLWPALQARERFRETECEKTVKVISFIHSTHYSGRTPGANVKTIYEGVFNPIGPQADSIVVLTDSQREDVLAQFPTLASKLHAIPHTFAREVSDQIQLPYQAGGGPKVVYVARLSKEKNHSTALEIFSLVLTHLPSATLHLYGIGPEEQTIRAKAQELGVSNNVVFEGYVSDLEEIVDGARVAMHTSSMEGFSLSILELMALGCPVVAFDVNYGPGTLIRDGETGYLVDEGNIKEFAEKLIEVIDDDEKNLSFARESANRIRDYFSPASVAQKWRNLLLQA